MGKLYTHLEVEYSNGDVLIVPLRYVKTKVVGEYIQEVQISLRDVKLNKWKYESIEDRKDYIINAERINSIKMSKYSKYDKTYTEFGINEKSTLIIDYNKSSGLLKYIWR
ncbi:MAG: hypothetical protein ACRC7S_04355 [Cetobacterium sp.]